MLPEPQQSVHDLRALMQEAAFRRVMLRLVSRSGILSSTFGPDSRTAAYLDGRRSLGLELLNEIDAIEPGALARILTEPLSTTREPKHVHRSDPLDQLRTDADEHGD